MSSTFSRRVGAAALFVAALALGSWLGSVTDTTQLSIAQTAGETTEPQGAPLNQASDDIYSDDGPIVRVVAQVKDAVVNIEAESDPDRDESRERSWLPFFHPPTGRSQSFGSGFFIRPDGTILTNAHVVADADRVTVRLSDEHEYRADVLGVDRETDLAVVRIDAGRPMPYIELGESDDLKIGQWVVAIGNPFPRQRLDRTVTVGVISGVGRTALWFGEDTPTYQNYIQTDAAINPGNSGGPLINLHGEAVGVNAAIASPSGGNVGIGFAIPVSYVKAVLPALVQEGRVARGWLGIRPGEVTADMAEAMELSTEDGVVVQQVIKDSPADASGLKQGDVIVRFNGEQVLDVQQFMFLVAQTRPETRVDVDVIREGRPEKLGVRLAERTDQVLASSGGSRRPADDVESWFGMEVRTATRALAERFSVPFEPGVIVTEVEPGSPADDKAITRGTIITSIAHEKISSLEDFRRIRAEREGSDRPVLFLVTESNGQPRFVALKRG